MVQALCKALDDLYVSGAGQKYQFVEVFLALAHLILISYDCSCYSSFHRLSEKKVARLRPPFYVI